MGDLGDRKSGHFTLSQPDSLLRRMVPNGYPMGAAASVRIRREEELVPDNDSGRMVF